MKHAALALDSVTCGLDSALCAFVLRKQPRAATLFLESSALEQARKELKASKAQHCSGSRLESIDSFPLLR